MATADALFVMPATEAVSGAKDLTTVLLAVSITYTRPSATHPRAPSAAIAMSPPPPPAALAAAAVHAVDLHFAPSRGTSTCMRRAMRQARNRRYTGLPRPAFRKL